jgi:hypothetical protein
MFCKTRDWNGDDSGDGALDQMDGWLVVLTETMKGGYAEKNRRGARQTKRDLGVD